MLYLTVLGRFELDMKTWLDGFPMPCQKLDSEWKTSEVWPFENDMTHWYACTPPAKPIFMTLGSHTQDGLEKKLVSL